jgi:hypothetical protein
MKFCTIEFTDEFNDIGLTQVEIQQDFIYELLVLPVE